MAFILILPSVLYMFYSAGRGLTLPYWGWLLTVHRLLGSLTLVFGLLFVTNRWQWKRKKYMDAGFICWLGALGLGAVVYMILFGLISP